MPTIQPGTTVAADAGIDERRAQLHAAIIGYANRPHAEEWLRAKLTYFRADGSAVEVVEVEDDSVTAWGLPIPATVASPL